MKVAVPIRVDRVSPVFDVARRLLLVHVEGGAEISRHEQEIDEADLGRRAQRIAALGVDVLICGAISRTLEMMLIAQGVQVLPHICGQVEDVLQAFISGQWTEQTFLMPGCCGQRRRVRGRYGPGPSWGSRRRHAK